MKLVFLDFDGVLNSTTRASAHRRGWTPRTQAAGGNALAPGSKRPAWTRPPEPKWEDLEAQFEHAASGEAFIPEATVDDDLPEDIE